MAREPIRTPIYFRGSQDDAFKWREKLEQLSKMANWNDENKIRYRDDPYKWWIQESKRKTTWPQFVAFWGLFYCHFLIDFLSSYFL